MRPIFRGSQPAEYMKYLTGCAELFRDGYTDLCQFTLEKG
jgi:cyclopropane fatty-acyl-phospholipid synthase-like methyltransferase